MLEKAQTNRMTVVNIIDQIKQLLLSK